MLDGHTHDMLVSMVAAISIGVLLLVVSRRFNIPGIVLLLFGGFFLGPTCLGIVQPDSLGTGLNVIASLAIGLILFEGGLTLDLDGYRSASDVIKRLLTVGVLITWLTTALAIILIFGVDISTALIAGSLVIVTGPTVIAPLLRRINVTNRIRTILHWEGVLIDPIGVFIAVLCFEWVATLGGTAAVANFALRVAVGFSFGVLGGLGTYYAVKRRYVPEHMINVFAVACAVLVFGVAESILSESGLLAVTIAGFLLGFKKPVRLAQIREFKEQITELLIGTLFILLAARLSPEQFISFGQKGLMIVAVVMFVVRPLNILICSAGLGLAWREKLFLSWVAPRGIVAASMASLFVLSGKLDGSTPDDRFIETFVYSVISATIILQGFTAGWLARLLGLYQPERKGWVIVGAHSMGRAIAKFVTEAVGAQVLIIDSNLTAISQAKEEGFLAIYGDARNPETLDLDEILGVYSVGNLLALTDNEDLNTLVCQRWAEELDKTRLFRWGRISASAKSTTDAGILIWSDLPKPSLLSDALTSSAIRVVEQDGYEEDLADIKTAVAGVVGDRIILEPSSHPDLDLSELGKTLYLEQEIEFSEFEESDSVRT